MEIVEALLPLATPLDRLVGLPGNPRRGDIDAVARSYAVFGQRKPIVARRTGGSDDEPTGIVIAGNHQLAAAQRLGWESIAVVWTDDDEMTAKAFALADNRTGELGNYDDEALAEMLRDVSNEAELFEATAFSDADLAALLAKVEPDFSPVEVDEQPRLDQRDAARCPDCGFEWRVGPRGEIEPL